MKITALAMAGFKRYREPRTVDLSGRDLFVGPNGSGKSSHLEALTVALTGSLPRVGKRLQDTWTLKHAETDRLAAGVTFEGGQMIGFHVDRDGAALAEHIRINGDDLPVREGREKRAALVGDFAPMFDLPAFLGLSDAKKLDFLAGLVARGSLEPQALRAEIIRRTIVGLRGEKVVAAAAELLGLTEAEAARELVAKLPAQQQNAMEAPLLLALRQVEKDGLMGLANAAEMVKRTYLDRAKRIKERQAEVASLVGAPTVTLSADQVAELREKQTALRADLAEVNRQVGAAESARLAYQSAQWKRKEADARLQQADEAIAGRVPMDDRERAPLAAEVARLDADMAEMLTRRTALQADAERLWLVHEAGTCERCGRPVDDAMRSQLRLHAEQLQADLEAAERSLAEASDTRKVLGRRVQDDGALCEQITFRDAALAELKRLQADAPVVQDITLIDTRRAGLEAALKDADAKLAEAIRAQAAVTQRLAAEQAIAEQTEAGAVEKALAEALRGIVHAETATGLSALAERAGGLLAEVGLTFYCTADAGKVGFGLVREDRRLPFDALSGGERVLVSAALIVALVLLADPPAKVLCIEAAELDAGNSEALLGALSSMGKGLDNILVATCHDINWPDEWTSHPLEV